MPSLPTNPGVLAKIGSPAALSVVNQSFVAACNQWLQHFDRGDIGVVRGPDPDLSEALPNL